MIKSINYLLSFIIILVEFIVLAVLIEVSGIIIGFILWVVFFNFSDFFIKRWLN